MNIKIKLFLLFFTVTYVTYACAGYVIHLPDCHYAKRSGDVTNNVYYCDINESIKFSGLSSHWIYFSCCSDEQIGSRKNYFGVYDHLDLVHSKWIKTYMNEGAGIEYSASATNWKTSSQVLTVKRTYCRAQKFTPAPDPPLCVGC